jgi:DNA mismatch repair ATPase MutS
VRIVFGIHVAKMAGMPQTVILNSETIEEIGKDHSSEA